jgi:hypothetical protein
MSLSGKKLKDIEDASQQHAQEPKSQNRSGDPFRNGKDAHHKTGYENSNNGEHSGDAMDAYLQPIPMSGGPFGGRNETCFSMCGLLWRRRMSLKGALMFVEAWNQKWCQPPMDYTEWYEVVGNAYAAANTNNWKQDETEREFGENVKQTARRPP